MSNWTVSWTKHWMQGITLDWSPVEILGTPWEAIVRVWEAVTDVTWNNWTKG